MLLTFFICIYIGPYMGSEYKIGAPYESDVDLDLNDRLVFSRYL